MEIRILGPIEAYADGEALPLGGLRERGLLALFALSPGQTISIDRLIDELWGEDLPANPSNALQALVSRLRRAVGSDAIVTAAPYLVSTRTTHRSRVWFLRPRIHPTPLHSRAGDLHPKVVDDGLLVRRDVPSCSSIHESPVLAGEEEPAADSGLAGILTPARKREIFDYGHQ